METIIYLVKCDRMRQAERIECKELVEFLWALQQLMINHGPIELLWQERRTR